MEDITEEEHRAIMDAVNQAECYENRHAEIAEALVKLGIVLEDNFSEENARKVTDELESICKRLRSEVVCKHCGYDGRAFGCKRCGKKTAPVEEKHDSSH